MAMTRTLLMIAAVWVTSILPSSAQEIQYRFDTLTIPASALVPRSDNVAYDSNGVRMSTPSFDATFNAPVFLPNWAYISKVTLEAYDPSGGEFGGSCRVTMSRYRYNAFQILADLDTGIAEAPGDTRVSESLGHIVDNAEFSYGIQVTLVNGSSPPHTLRFYKVVIEYYWPEFY